MKKILLLGLLLFNFSYSFGEEKKSENNPCQIPELKSDFNNEFGLFSGQSNDENDVIYRLKKYIDTKQKEINLLQSQYYGNTSTSIFGKESLTDIYTDYYNLHRKTTSYIKRTKVDDGELISIANMPIDNIRIQVLINELRRYEERKVYNPYEINDENSSNSKVINDKKFITNANDAVETGYFYLTQNIYQDLVKLNIINTSTPNSIKTEQKGDHISLKISDLTSVLDLLLKLDVAKLDPCAEIKKSNMETLNRDLEEARSKLRKLSDVERLEQRFKIFITAIVGTLIAIILICFFGAALYKSNVKIKEKLIGESGLQFVTIFVIIIAVILFGIMNILKGSELAAILSAIAGYILGKSKNGETPPNVILDPNAFLQHVNAPVNPNPQQNQHIQQEPAPNSNSGVVENAGTGTEDNASEIESNSKDSSPNDLTEEQENNIQGNDYTYEDDNHPSLIDSSEDQV